MLQQTRLGPQQTSLQTWGLAQHWLLTHDAPSAQQCPAQYDAVGQHGPPLLLAPPFGMACVPSGQQRLIPTSLVQVRSGGQHADGAASLPDGSAQTFGAAQHDPWPEPALQQAASVGQQVLAAGSQQNVPLAQQCPAHCRVPGQRFLGWR